MTVIYTVDSGHNSVTLAEAHDINMHSGKFVYKYYC